MSTPREQALALAFLPHPLGPSRAAYDHAVDAYFRAVGESVPADTRAADLETIRTLLHP